MLETVTHHLAAVKVMEPCTYEKLTVFPLVGASAHGPDYATLDEALAAGTVSITEISDAGTVPVIRFSNAGDRPVPAWLQVVGERQRILVHQLPTREQIQVPLAEQLIVEYYSK